MVLKCVDRLLDLTEPVIMGIVNLTPDSFYDGGKYNSTSKVLKLCEKHVSEGATILDIGAVSSKPGAPELSIQNEWSRLAATLKIVVKEFPEIFISIDTFWAEIARRAALEGAHIINDISAGKMDEEMFQTVVRSKMAYIMMHMQGTPKTMQLNPKYQNVALEVFDFLKDQMLLAKSQGLFDIIIDPGFGFGKSIEHNYELLRKLEIFDILECPVLVGLSRKSMIYKLLDTNAAEALNGTTALQMVALQKGTKILRVHDVKEAAELKILWKTLQA